MRRGTQGVVLVGMMIGMSSCDSAERDPPLQDEAPVLDASGDTLADTTGGIAGADPVVIESESVGPVRLGMTLEDLRSAAPDSRDTTWQAEGMAERGKVVPVYGGSVTALIVEDTVARILIDDPDVQTSEGVGVGSRLGELRAAYGAACAGVGEGTVVVWFPDAPNLSFALDTEPTGNWDRVRNNPEQLPDSATITGMWVRHGLSGCPPA